MPYYHCNLDVENKGLDERKVIYEATTNQSKQIELGAEYKSVVVVVSAAANQDSSSHVDSLSVNTNGDMITLYNKKYDDKARGVLKTLCYLVKKKNDEITITVNGTQVWGIYTVLVLG